MPAKRRRSTSAAAASSSSAPVKGSWSYKTAAAQAAAETAVASAAAACKKRTKPGAEVSAFVEREEMLKFTRHYDRQKLMSVRDSPARNEFIRRAGNQLLSFLVHDPSSPFSPKPGMACVFPHELLTSIIIPYWSDAYEFDNEWMRETYMSGCTPSKGDAFVCRMRLTNPLIHSVPDDFLCAAEWPLLANHTQMTRDDLKIGIRLQSGLTRGRTTQYLAVSGDAKGVVNICAMEITYSHAEPPAVSLYTYADEMVSGAHLHASLIVSPDVYHYEKDEKTVAEFKRDPKPAFAWAEIRCQLDCLCELLEAKTCRTRYRHKSKVIQTIRDQLAVIHELFRSKAVRVRKDTQMVGHE